MTTTSFTVRCPDNLTDPILDIDGDELRLSDQTNAEGRRLDIEVDDPSDETNVLYNRFNEDAVRELRDRLTAWLDAPATVERVP